MKNKVLIGLSALVLMGVALVTPRFVNAYRGDSGMQGPNCTPERHEVMTQAFENGDYNTWKESMQGKGRVTEIINEENFTRFAEAHRLVLEGKTEEAKQIREELGLGMGNKYGQSGGNRQGEGNGKGGWGE